MLMFLGFPAAAPAGTDKAGAGMPSLRSTDLPLPRFVSLNSDKVYVRTGPANRYPIKWVYQKRNMPVEIIQEFENWRKVRDFETGEGWIHQSMLSGERTALIKSEDLVPLREDANTGARMVARIEPYALASLEKCASEWCRVEAGSYHGWIERNFLWGIYEDEDFN